ncbi:hypothetical protein AN480_28900 (plasmid) [Mycobacterium intracellulare subsp. chimaera]|nr:hypothetical protein AN480_28900 [Mycobacterium intracellulare subsp. chimaera]
MSKALIAHKWMIRVEVLTCRTLRYLFRVKSRHADMVVLGREMSGGVIAGDTVTVGAGVISITDPSADVSVAILEDSARRAHLILALGN